MVRTGLISWTVDAEKIIEEAYLLCRRRFSDVVRVEEGTSSRMDQIWKDKHFGCFEEGSASIVATGISRSCSHQLVRHRLFSFKQLSMRAVPVPKLSRIIPPSYQREPTGKALKIEAWVNRVTRDAYDGLVELGIPLEDARFITPIGIETQIHITGNFRTWLHFLNMRTPKSRDPEETYRPGKGPQWEIRALAWECHEHLKKVAPNIFADRYKELWRYV